MCRPSCTSRRTKPSDSRRWRVVVEELLLERRVGLYHAVTHLAARHVFAHGDHQAIAATEDVEEELVLLGDVVPLVGLCGVSHLGGPEPIEGARQLGTRVL